LLPGGGGMGCRNHVHLRRLSEEPVQTHPTGPRIPHDDAGSPWRVPETWDGLQPATDVVSRGLGASFIGRVNPPLRLAAGVGGRVGGSCPEWSVWTPSSWGSETRDPNRCCCVVPDDVGAASAPRCRRRRVVGLRFLAQYSICVTMSAAIGRERMPHGTNPQDRAGMVDD
jgi:hypothetical protein